MLLTDEDGEDGTLNICLTMDETGVEIFYSRRDHIPKKQISAFVHSLELLRRRIEYKS